MSRPREHSHAARITGAQGFPIQDPLRMLALAVISQAEQDASEGHYVEMDTEAWAMAAGVPERWLLQLGIYYPEWAEVA